MTNRPDSEAVPKREKPKKKLEYEHRECKVGDNWYKETDKRYNAGWNDNYDLCEKYYKEEMIRILKSFKGFVPKDIDNYTGWHKGRYDMINYNNQRIDKAIEELDNE